MTETVTQALARKDEQRTPAELIRQYSGDFATVLPSHIKPETWVRIAQGALKRGKRLPDGRFELEVAAVNNPGAFLAALLDAARQGLEPGTDQYYLTPRRVKGQLEILGITGYQGYIELMYRAGAVSSVVAEVVRKEDVYRFERGVDHLPVHKFTPFTGEAERGPLRGVYGYALMHDGAVSRVIELGPDQITRIKRSSTASESEYSPWQTDPDAMWLKSAVRQLRKWVPTSAEFRRELLRAHAEAARIAEQNGLPIPMSAEEADDIIDGDAWPEVTAVPDAA